MTATRRRPTRAGSAKRARKAPRPRSAPRAPEPGNPSAAWRCPRCGRGFAARNASHSCAVQAVADLLRPYPAAWPVYAAVRDAIAAIGPAEVAATKTQVAWRRRIGFAWLWVPAMALRRGAPDVYASFALPVPVRSSRIKEVIEVRPGRFMHHVLVPDPSSVDPELEGWLRAAYEAAA